MGPEDKKKAYALGGLAGLIGIAGLVVLHPWARSGSSTTSASTSPAAMVSSTPSSSSSSSAPSGAGSPAAAGASDAAVAGRGASAQLVAAEQFRDDPFTPFYSTVPTPLPVPPTPKPPPPRPTPTPIPPPLDIPSPSSSSNDIPQVPRLPPFPGGNSPATALAGLPQARVSRLVNAPTAPRVQTPPATPGSSGTGSAFERSPNKRLAGVAIGDSVRALLEVEDPTTGEFRTYIVQPGQRVDAENLQVLRIERTTEGGQSRVRMVVREKGEIRVIELREGQRPDIAATGGGGEGGGGYPGSSGSSSSSGGGYPGSGGGYPRGGGGYPGGGGGYPGGGGGYPGSGFPGNASPPGFPGGRPGFGGRAQ